MSVQRIFAAQKNCFFKARGLPSQVKGARLIEKASPGFIEIKAYMHLGFSRLRLDRSAMPTHEEVLEFSKELAKHLRYEIADESEISRVVLLSKNGKKSPAKRLSYYG